MIVLLVALIALAAVAGAAIHFRDDIADLVIVWAKGREPGLIIGDPSDPYMHRIFVVPKNRVFNIFVHRIMRDDDDRALHDHPWWSVSWIFRNHYFDIVPKFPDSFRICGHGRLIPVRREEWSMTFRRATDLHRIVLPGPGKTEAWSLFITGPEIRDWGFLCPQGWRSSKVFSETRDGVSVVGRGCA
ncbi:hypothetical protein [Parvibaculum sp.]|uniref:hypothetical protein n=1 Tax=Parvibaculum sp. TaxID=2024848 RepID=UPI002732A20B|nr:hypothetical protein [Parvibaculum sp.]MDP3327165.1 hypothetical protein [Parvibaculum sp.]